MSNTHANMRVFLFHFDYEPSIHSTTLARSKKLDATSDARSLTDACLLPQHQKLAAPTIGASPVPPPVVVDAAVAGRGMLAYPVPSVPRPPKSPTVEPRLRRLFCRQRGQIIQCMQCKQTADELVSYGAAQQNPGWARDSLSLRCNSICAPREGQALGWARGRDNAPPSTHAAST